MIYEKPILVTGAARSGTSMVAGVLHICGAWGGDMSGPTRYNRKGMFENADIRNNIVKPWLVAHGWDRMGQDPLPDIDKIKKMPNLIAQSHEIRDKVLGVIASQGYKGGKWFYKGAKMCLMWPVWYLAFPEALWVIVRRKPDDIVQSCMKTSFMRAHQKRSGWLLWVAEHEKRFEEMADARLCIQEVWPQRAVDGDLTEIQQVVNNLGLNWKFGEVQKFITPSLWHKAKKQELEEDGNKS